MIADLEKAVASIRRWHRLRIYHMEQRKRSDLSLLSFLRMMLGWSKALPDAERKWIAERAQALVKLGEDELRAQEKKKAFETDDQDYLEWRDTITATVASRAPHDALEARAEKELEALAKSLPIYPWVKGLQGFTGIRGFGAGSLAVIVAEAGDLSNYATHSKLWKRMGLAVMDGVRQGGLSKNASKSDWIAHGYNRVRRSRVWNIGDTLIKGNKDGAYRTAYLARKEYEAERARAAGLTVAPSAKIPDKRKAEYMSEGHIHRRAQRFMEKKLLRDLWRAWRDERQGVDMMPIRPLSDFSAAQPNEQEAKVDVPEMAMQQLPTARLNKRQAKIDLLETAALSMPVA